MADLTSTIGSLASFWPKTRDESEEERRKERQRNGAPYYEGADEVVCRTICSRCEEFDLTGPVGFVGALFRHHLAGDHPEVSPTPRKGRRRR